MAIQISSSFSAFIYQRYYLRNVVFQDYKGVVDYAIINSYMVMKEYTIVVFDSQSDAIQLPSLFDDLRKQYPTE